ncbi:hypothetical protein PYW07_011574 [Mythimna separata]|uniref:Uncharacterized protein n=1 Tax=Mythimna separata TaxID=271217 RepID=A0AAD7YAC3_MYTSE|nr:hypothetical protein PYW07_011574 [Mythimna separata]
MLSNSITRARIIRNATPLISAVRGKAAYEGEGKTTVRVINQEADAGLMIDTYATVSPTAFDWLVGSVVTGPDCYARTNFCVMSSDRRKS